LGVAFADDEDHRRGVGRRAVGEFLGVVGRYQALLGQEIDVRGLIHRYHVGLKTVGDGAHLLARSGMRLPEVNRLTGRRLPVFLEQRVEILIEIARDVIGNVQQAAVREHGRRQCGNKRKNQGS
jgi:hypothetical protein